jgi:hypothetical protein
MSRAATAVVLAFLASSPRPDLVERAVALSRTMVPAGGTVRATDVVRNVGSKAASRSTTSYYLMPGRVRLGMRPVGTLQARASSGGSVSLRIPATVRPKRYRVEACADARRHVRESREANNCSTARSFLTVTRGEDRSPPRFTGLTSATTCIPGPIGEGRSAAYQLKWSPATDDVTPSAALVYDVYQATTSGAENYAMPTYSTDPGQTTFTTPPLPSTKTFYFVVRARDRAGNRDENKIEREGVNLCV